MNHRHRLTLVLLALAISIPCLAQEPPERAKAKARAAAGYTLTISGEIDAAMAPVVGKLTTIYYETYPKLVERFENPKKPVTRHVHLVMQKGLRVPAFASRDKITVSVDWLTKHPDDVALLAHELTHIVQGYPSGDPGWFTEGLADYARHVYGPKEQPGWALPKKFTPRNSYKDSYRVTGRFLLWLEAKHPGTVDKLHRNMQDRTFQIGDFKSFTEKSVDDLWSECVAEVNGK